MSTMGLMNVGQTEGSQIIQLFGRGVRLKGYGSSLKRSGQAQLPDDVTRPKHIGVLETLSIFGIRADYMAQFRDFLEEEGLPVNDDRIEFLLPIIKNSEPRSSRPFASRTPSMASAPSLAMHSGAWVRFPLCRRPIRQRKRRRHTFRRTRLFSTGIRKSKP